MNTVQANKLKAGNVLECLNKGYQVVAIVRDQAESKRTIIVLRRHLDNTPVAVEANTLGGFTRVYPSK